MHPAMPTEMAILLLTGAIAALGVLVYLWTAGASLLMAIEIHLLRVETHLLRIEYARRIAALSEGDETIAEIVGDDEEEESPEVAEPMKAAA